MSEDSELARKGSRPYPVERRCRESAVRKEWRTLSSKQRKDWIVSMKCLASLPHDQLLTPTIFPGDIPPVNPNSSFYDDIVYMHMDLNIVIHSTGQFLPWHRWYIQVVEDSLRKKCGYQGHMPYWDWTLDASDFYGASIWDSHPVSGHGRWGDPDNDWIVPDGGLVNFSLAYPVPHPLRRQFTPNPFKGLDPEFYPDQEKLGNTTFTKAEMDYMVNGFVGDFVGFAKYYQSWQGAHPIVHFMTDGDLGGGCPRGAPSSCTPDKSIHFKLRSRSERLSAEDQNGAPMTPCSSFIMVWSTSCDTIGKRRMLETNGLSTEARFSPFPVVISMIGIPPAHPLG